MNPADVEFLMKQFSPGRDASDLRALVVSMLSKPDPIFATYPDEPPMGVDKAAKWMHSLQLLDPALKSGWVTREGRFLSCGFCGHDRILYWLDMTEPEAEAKGWARIGIINWQCLYRVTKAQARRIEAAGMIVDPCEELLKPHWTAAAAWLSPAIT